MVAHEYIDRGVPITVVLHCVGISKRTFSIVFVKAREAERRARIRVWCR